MRSLTPWWTAFLLGIASIEAPPLGAQVPLPGRVAEVDGATAVTLSVLWGHGFLGDAGSEHGAARALAECRLERARLLVPGTTASGVQVFADATVAFVLVAAADWSRGQRFCEALLDDSLPIADDLVAKAVARAALAADDAEWIYPGSVLQTMARHALFDGAMARPVAGSAPALQQLTVARVRQLLRVPLPVSSLALGAVPAPWSAAASAMAPAIPAVLERTVAPLRPSAMLAPETRCNSRIDGPFVAVAFAVASTTSRPALAVAVEVARARAARSLRLRGGEMVARAPIVSWSWLHGDPLLQFCRRGANGADPATAREELAALVADLVARPPSPQELAAALHSLQHELAVPPLPPVMARALAAAPEALPGRAMVALLVAHRGIDPDRLPAVTPAAAHAALVATCGAGAGWWGILVPTASAAGKGAAGSASAGLGAKGSEPAAVPTSR